MSAGDSIQCSLFLSVQNFSFKKCSKYFDIQEFEFFVTFGVENVINNF